MPIDNAMFFWFNGVYMDAEMKLMNECLPACGIYDIFIFAAGIITQRISKMFLCLS
jgi:hypothetical protein